LERLLLVFSFLYATLSRFSLAHHFADFLFRQVLHIDGVDLELHRDPADDSIAKPRMALLCALMSWSIVHAFLNHDRNKKPSAILAAVYALTYTVQSFKDALTHRLGLIDARLNFIEDNHNKRHDDLLKAISKRVDLSDARKVAPRMSRKQLHRIALDSLSRRMRNMKIRLDAQQIENMRLVFQNEKLVLSAATLDAQVEMLITKYSTPSITGQSNIEKLDNILESETRKTYTQNAQIQSVVSENTKLLADLHTTREELEQAKISIENSASVAHELEKSLRGTEHELQQAKQNLEHSRAREETLLIDAQKSRGHSEDEDGQVRMIGDELQAAQRTMRDLHSSHDALQSRCDELATGLEDTKEQLSSSRAMLQQKNNDLIHVQRSSAEQTEQLQAQQEEACSEGHHSGSSS
jgi:chromosome segregation ATPase